MFFADAGIIPTAENILVLVETDKGCGFNIKGVDEGVMLKAGGNTTSRCCSWGQLNLMFNIWM